MRVITKEGLRVPTEKNARKYHTATTADQAETVERTAYYLRRLRDGDLIEVADGSVVDEATSDKKTTKGA